MSQVASFPELVQAQPTVVDPPVKTGRLTVKEAFDAARESFGLGKLLAKQEPGGKKGWVTQFQADAETAQKFFDTLMADLTLITGCKFSIDFAGRSTTLLENQIKYRSTLRVEDVHAIWEAFQREFGDALGQVCGQLKGQTDESGKETRRWHMPLNPVEMSGDTAKFECEYLRKLNAVTMLEPSFVCPDDFPKNILPAAKARLGVLKGTTFDYQPKILEGITLRRDAVKTTQKIASIPRLVYDPALVLNINDRHFVSDYWEEPLPTAKQERRASIDAFFRRTGTRWTLFSGITASFAVFFIGSFWWFPNFSEAHGGWMITARIAAAILFIIGCIVHVAECSMSSSTDSDYKSENYFRSPYRILRIREWQFK